MDQQLLLAGSLLGFLITPPIPGVYPRVTSAVPGMELPAGMRDVTVQSPLCQPSSPALACSWAWHVRLLVVMVGCLTGGFVVSCTGQHPAGSRVVGGQGAEGFVSRKDPVWQAGACLFLASRFCRSHWYLTEQCRQGREGKVPSPGISLQQRRQGHGVPGPGGPGAGGMPQQGGVRGVQPSSARTSAKIRRESPCLGRQRVAPAWAPG